MEQHNTERETLTEEQCRALLLERYSIYPPILLLGVLVVLVYAGLLAFLTSLAQNPFFSYLCMGLFGLVLCIVLFEGTVSVVRYIWVKNGNYTIYRDVINSKKKRRRRWGGRYSALHNVEYLFCLSYSGKYILPRDNFPGTNHRMTREDFYASVLAGEEVFLIVFPSRHVAMLFPMRYFAPPTEPKDPSDWGKNRKSGASDPRK